MNRLIVADELGSGANRASLGCGAGDRSSIWLRREILSEPPFVQAASISFALRRTYSISRRDVKTVS